MFEGAVSALSAACLSLGSDKGRRLRNSDAENAIELGLVGVAAELSMAACLIQVQGKLIRSDSGKFPTYAEIRSRFLRLLQERVPGSNFMFAGIENIEEHHNGLINHVRCFAALGPLRAAALHGGHGLLHEAVVAKANEVSDFLAMLARSSRIRHCLHWVPRCRLYHRERALLIEELARLLDAGGEPGVLSSLFLVLPEVPDDEPEWLGCLERVSIAPRKNDIQYLLRVASRAEPALLRRSSPKGSVLNVVIRPDDPKAVLIAPQFLRSSFSSIKEQWYADRGTANGRLNEGVLDLPPKEAVWAVFATGLQESGVLEANKKLSGHDAWPFVAASLSAQGEPGPYWFIVRETEDWGQMIAMLQKATQYGNSYFRRRLSVLIDGVDAIKGNRDLPSEHGLVLEYRRRQEFARRTRAGLEASHSRHRGQARELPDHLVSGLQEVITTGNSFGPFLAQVLESSADNVTKCYWAKQLAACVHDLGDAEAIVAMLSNQDLRSVHSEAKKALRWLDVRICGPQMETQD